MHKKTHNTQPSKPPVTARPGSTFEMDAGDTTPGGMAVGVMQEKETALAICVFGFGLVAAKHPKSIGQIWYVFPRPSSGHPVHQPLR